jgi:archaeal type IV pilus assembly protein PilA
MLKKTNHDRMSRNYVPVPVKCTRVGRAEGGVSPVVGVMLMLSVTVIIAAIVSAAAGGLSGTETKAPSAILEVRFYENRSYGGDSFSNAMSIEHISGNPLQTKDLGISTYFRNESGQLIRGSLQGEKAVAVGSDYCGVLYINDQARFSGSPIWNSDTGYKSWFGNASAVLMAGDVLVTPAQYYGSTHENAALDAILNFRTFDPSGQINNGYRAGSVITVKIVHLPSGQLIFDKDVVVV